MTREQFDQLVRQVQQRYAKNPRGLRQRTLRLALLGYAGLLASFLLFVFIAAGLFSLAAFADTTGAVMSSLLGVVVLFGGGGLALRSLLVKITPPTGLALSPADAPVLFAELERLRTTLRCPRFHQVLLTTECNAGVTQRPRLGWLGWSQNYLQIGLPLLAGLAPEEMSSVLAHEFAHLSRADARLSHWLYRLRASWERLEQQPVQAGALSLRPLITKFLGWVWPRFNAHAFVLSRAQEYAADAQAASLGSSATTASALIRLHYLTALLGHKIWPAIWQSAKQQPQPPSEIFARVHEALAAGTTEDERSRWRREGFAATTTNANTHPCLTDRIAALAIPAAAVPDRSSVAAPSAAEKYLGANLDGLSRQLSSHWQREVATAWSEHHLRASALTHRLASIDQTSQALGEDADTLWERALTHLRLHGDEGLEPLLQQTLARRAEHPLANYHLGRLQLERRLPEGEAQLEKAIALDETLLSSAAQVLHEFYRRTGQADRLRALSIRLDRHEVVQAAARAERISITARDKIRSHDLNEDQLRILFGTLATEPEIHSAHLVEKVAQHFPKQKIFALCVQTRSGFLGLPRSEADRALAQRLSPKIQLPGRVFVFPPGGAHRALARKIRRHPGAGIWPG